MPNSGACAQNGTGVDIRLHFRRRLESPVICFDQGSVIADCTPISKVLFWTVLCSVKRLSQLAQVLLCSSSSARNPKASCTVTVQCSVQNYFELGQNGRVAEGVAESLPELAELAGLFQFHF